MKSFVSFKSLACLVTMMVVAVKAAPAPASPEPPVQVPDYANAEGIIRYFGDNMNVEADLLLNPTVNSCHSFVTTFKATKVFNQTPYNVVLYRDGSCTDRKFIVNIGPKNDWIHNEGDPIPLSVFVLSYPE